MHKDELRQLLTDFAAERLAILQRHEAAARVVSHYDFNNTYQYVIAREETHIAWLQNALAEFGVALPAPRRVAAGSGGAERARSSSRRRSRASSKTTRGRCAASSIAGGRRVDADDPRAPPDDAERRARGVARARRACSNRAPRATRICSAAAPAWRSGSARCCRTGGWNSTWLPPSGGRSPSRLAATLAIAERP